MSFSAFPTCYIYAGSADTIPMRLYVPFWVLIQSLDLYMPHICYPVKLKDWLVSIRNAGKESIKLFYCQDLSAVTGYKSVLTAISHFKTLPKTKINVSSYQYINI